MSSLTELQLLRKKDVISLFGISHSTHYSLINKGLMVPPIQLGSRSSAYPKYEINKIITARISGKSDDEIKSLVAELIEKRKTVFS